MNLNQAEDSTFEFFKNSGFAIEEWPFLDPNLEWRPRAVVSRTRRTVLSRAALVVRENFSSYKEPFNWEPLVETRRQMPTLPIYFVVPEAQNTQPLNGELAELGIGLYVIRPDNSLSRALNSVVPFDDVILTFPIEPDKPYRNRQNVLKVLGHADQFLWWLDKHFTSVGIDFLYDFFNNWPYNQNISEVKILGSSLVNQPEINNLRVRIAAFAAEMAPRGVTVEMRLMDPNTRNTIHDRYLISNATAFNILPTRSLERGQRGSLVLDDNPPDFAALWNTATQL